MDHFSLQNCLELNCSPDVMPQRLNGVEARSLTGLLQKASFLLRWVVVLLHQPSSWWTDHLRLSLPRRHISQLGWGSDEGVPWKFTSTHDVACSFQTTQLWFHLSTERSPVLLWNVHVLLCSDVSTHELLFCLMMDSLTKMLACASVFCKASTLGFFFTAVSLPRCSFVLWCGPHGAHQATLLEQQTQIWCVFFIGQGSFNQQLQSHHVDWSPGWLQLGLGEVFSLVPHKCFPPSTWMFTCCVQEKQCFCVYYLLLFFLCCCDLKEDQDTFYDQFTHKSK